MDENFLFSFFITLITGLATGIGGLAAFFVKKNDFKILSFILGFSSGVMLYVSLTALLPESFLLFSKSFGKFSSFILTLVFFIIGMGCVFLTEKFLPEELVDNSLKKTLKKDHQIILKTSFLMAVILAIHNLPEGLSTFMAILLGGDISYPVAISMAMHNIPEGVAFCLPVLFLTKNPKKAFLYTLLTGFIEPIGALLGYLVFLPLIQSGLVGSVFAFVSGMMMLVSIIALYPAFRKRIGSVYCLVGFFVACILSALMFM